MTNAIAYYSSPDITTEESYIAKAPGAFPRVEQVASLGYNLALPTNIRLGWKGFPGTNTLAYYEIPYVTTVKSFIGLAPVVDFSISIILTKHFCQWESHLESFKVAFTHAILQYTMSLLLATAILKHKKYP